MSTTRRTRSSICTLSLLAAVLAATCASVSAGAKPTLVVSSPGISPTPAGKVLASARLRAPRSAGIRSARFYVNGKLVTTDRSYPFAIKRGVRFDTRSLPAAKPYVTILVKFEQSKRNGKTATRSLRKRVRVSFTDGGVGTSGERPPPMTGYRLALNEEFDGDTLDTTLWNDQRTDSIDEEDPENPAMSRPFNTDEGAAYGPDNVSVGDGLLSLALRDTPAPHASAANYERSTGMVNTKGKFAFKYGYVETRAWVPEAMGSWPTFWIMPSTDDQWPPEIDIFEYVYITEYPARYPHAIFHWSPDGPHGDDQYQHDTSETSSIPSPKPQEWFTTRPVGDSFATNYMGQWHTYGLLWERDRADVYVDGQYRLSVHGASKLPQQPMYLIYQMAIMKASLGRGIPPAGSTMKIDYLRVYTNDSST